MLCYLSSESYLKYYIMSCYILYVVHIHIIIYLSTRPKLFNMLNLGISYKYVK